VEHRPRADAVELGLLFGRNAGGVAAFGEKEEVLKKVLRPNVVPAIKPGPQVVQGGAPAPAPQPQPQKGREEAAAS